MKRPFGFRAQVRAYVNFVEGKKLARIKALAKYPRRGGILFLGDSLTEEFPFGELLPEFPIVGRGYSGDTASMLRERLPYTCTPYAPAAVFLQAGINDLQRGASPEETARSVGEALIAVRKLCPGAKLHLLALYPVNCSSEKFSLFRPKAFSKREALTLISRTNTLLREEAAAWGAEFHDFGDVLRDGGGELREEFSCDGLHLTVEGYHSLSEALRPALAEALVPSLVRCGQTEEHTEVLS